MPPLLQLVLPETKPESLASRHPTTQPSSSMTSSSRDKELSSDLILLCSVLMSNSLYFPSQVVSPKLKIWSKHYNSHLVLTSWQTKLSLKLVIMLNSVWLWATTGTSRSIRPTRRRQLDSSQLKISLEMLVRALPQGLEVQFPPSLSKISITTQVSRLRRLCSVEIRRQTNSNSKSDLKPTNWSSHQLIFKDKRSQTKKLESNWPNPSTWPLKSAPEDKKWTLDIKLKKLNRRLEDN